MLVLAVVCTVLNSEGQYSITGIYHARRSQFVLQVLKQN